MRKPLLIALLAAVSLSPAALARDYDTLDEFEKFTRTYMATNIGLEPMDYELFVRGEAHLGERQPIQALAIFAKLAEKYPTHPTLHLFMGRAQLQLNQLDEAQSTLEKTKSLLDSHTAPRQIFQTYLFLAETQMRMNQRASAISLLKDLPIDPKVLDLNEWEAYHVYLAQLYLNNGQPAESYAELKKVIDSGQRADRAITYLNAHRSTYAEAYYQAARTAFYSDRAYGSAGTLAREAMRLDPGNERYTDLSAEAHKELQAVLLMRFQRSLPVLNNNLRNLRYALEMNDDRGAYQAWLRLKDNDDIAFILNNDYDLYLPAGMIDTLRAVEAELKAKGYRI